MLPISDKPNKEDKDLDEILDRYMQENQLYHFEGESGVEKFKGLLSDLGYDDDRFRNGILGLFLADNPEAIECLLEWIGKANIQEWRESLSSHLEEEDEGIDD